MKKCVMVLTIMLLAAASSVGAQSIADDLAQLSLDYEKLSELKSILSDMEKGYQIVSQGYETIKNLSEGNFNLHKIFLDGLLAVSPAVQHYQKVISIINNQEQIGKEYKAAYARFTSGNIFSGPEQQYIGGVYNNLFTQSLKNLEELTMVMTASQLRMSDGERLSAIDRIDKDVQDKLQFLRYFNNNTSVQALQRARDQDDNGAVMSFYGLSN